MSTVLRTTFVIGLLAAGRATAATHVVAPAGGDFTSIQAALDVATAGDTIDVRTGVYAEKLVFPRSGDAGLGPIILRAAPGHTPVVDGTGVAGDNLVLIENRSWVQVVGLELRNNLGLGDGSGIRVLGSGDHIELRNNRIHEIRGSNAMGITIFAIAATPVTNLVIDGNEIYDCDAAPSEALTVNGNADGFAVTNNHVHDVNNIGIVAIGGERDLQPDPTKVARNGRIAFNRVERARSIYGGGFAGGIYVDGGDDIVVEHNVVTQSDLGLEVGAENKGQVATGVVVRDNVLYGNDKAGLVFGGYSAAVGRVRDCEFRNNVLYGNDTLGAGFGELWIQYAEQNVVRNNVIWSTAANRLLTSDAGNADNVIDYNRWYSDGGAAIVTFTWNGDESVGFAAYQAATGQDAHSTFGDPSLANPGAADFHLQAGSPAVNAGDPSTVVGVGETDVDGAPRLSGPRIDIGVDERTCGDLVLDPGEACDDGNQLSGDGCDANCTVTGCGNSIVTAGEQCDDGNLSAGDCCDAACQYESTGSPCTDGDPCTRGDACHTGVCAGIAEPEPICAVAGKAQLVVKNATNDKADALTWKWQRGTATLSDFGAPLSTTGYTVCLYDTPGGVSALARKLRIPGGGTCHGKACWKPTGTVGFKYSDRDLTPDGVQSLQLKAGAAGSAAITLKAKGGNLLPPLPLAQNPAVTLQLRNDLGACWGSAFTAPAGRNDGTQFSDKLP